MVANKKLNSGIGKWGGGGGGGGRGATSSKQQNEKFENL